MSKENIKRDKNGRFSKKAGKVEVEIHVEPKPEKDLSDLICVSRGEYEQLKLERDAFKLTSEKMSGKYLDKCQEVKDLMPYECHCDYQLCLIKTWKDRALAEKEKRLFAMDALRVASMRIWWLRSKLSWFKLWKNRKKLVEMDVEMDRMVARVEGLDRE